MELGSSLPHSQESTTCPYPSQINPFLCPSHFRQAQLVSLLVGLRTYQHPDNSLAGSHIGNTSYSHLRDDLFGVVTWDWHLETLMDFLYLSKNANTVTVSILSYKPATMRRQVGWMAKHSDFILEGGGTWGLQVWISAWWWYIITGFSWVYSSFCLPFDVT